MFTGLIASTGSVVRLEETAGIYQLRIQFADVKGILTGESISINGCCLSVTAVDKHAATVDFDVGSVTVKATNFLHMSPGTLVNVERSTPLGQRLDGHLVTGHVDDTALLRGIDRQASGWILEVQVAKEHGKYLIRKGSVCLDGVSLTISEIEDRSDITVFWVMIIPVTLARTHFRSLAAGWQFNIEFDVVGKYVARLLQLSKNP